MHMDFDYVYSKINKYFDSLTHNFMHMTYNIHT